LFDLFRWGKANNLLNSVTYGGHRRLLEMQHYLRSFGQTKKCCVKDYYVNNKKQVIIDSFINNPPSKNPQRFAFTTTYNQDFQRERDNNWVCCQATFDKHHNFFRNKNRAYVEHCLKYDLQVFAPYLYYHTCDYREQLLYERISNDLYIKDGIKASKLKDNMKNKANNNNNNNNNNAYEFLTAKAKLAIVRKKEDEIHINGVKKPWIFALLVYSCIAENICYDPFHVLKNIVTYLFSMIFGRTKVRSSTVQFCNNTASHPTIMIKKEKKKKKKKGSKQKQTIIIDNNDDPQQINVWRGIWQLSIPMLKKLEIYLQNVLIPSGSNSSLRLKASISSFGLVKGKELIEMCECSMDFICWSIQQISKREEDNKYPNEYLYFYCMLSSYISELLAPIILDANVDALYNKAVEIISVYEGIFPVSETKMIHHQLIDLPYYIKQFGPLRGWWTLPSERSIAQIKREMGSNKGGRNFAKKVYKREYSKEFLKQKEIYENKESLFRDKNFFVKKENNNEQSFTSYKTEVLWHDKYKPPIIDSLTKYEIQEYLSFLIDLICNIQRNEYERIQLSPLYRLFMSFKYYRNNYKNLRDEDGNKVQKFSKDATDFSNFLESLSVSNIHECLLLNDEDDKLFILNQGKCFMRNDLPLINYYLFQITSNIAVSNKALIWGTKFNARGREFKENDQYSMIPFDYGSDILTQKRNNDLNNLSENYNLKRVYSSWFKSNNGLVYDYDDNDGVDVDDDINIGQFNCFFTLDIDQEPILNHLPVALVTMRETNKVLMFKYNDQNKKINKDYYYENLFQSYENIKLNSNNCIFQLLYSIYPVEITCAPQKISTFNTLSPVCKTSKEKPECYMHFQINRNHLCILDNKDIFKKTNHPYNRNINLNK
jgi:hypothetical protein